MIYESVLIADDHEVFRSGLRQLLENHFATVEEARDGSEAVDLALSSNPQVVIMDVAMPRMDGIEATRRIKEQLPHTGVVMLSATDTDQDVFNAIQAGANGYVLKDDEPQTVVQAVHHAAEGKAYLPPLIAKRVLDGVAGGLAQGQPRNREIPLSSRELAVLRLMAGGKRNRQIANDLGISERTVGNHITGIYDKLCIRDRAEAIVYAIKKGIVRD